MITLLQVIAQAALDQNLDVKTSELHGLSQRGGSVSVHIRFGKQVYSPVVPKGKADVIIALETQEVLNAAPFALRNAVFLVNEYQTPTLGQSVSESYIKNILSSLSKRIFFLQGSQITEKELGTNVVVGIFFLGWLAKRGLIPFKEEALKTAIKKVMPERHWDINIKAIDLGGKYGDTT